MKPPAHRREGQQPLLAVIAPRTLDDTRFASFERCARQFEGQVPRALFSGSNSIFKALFVATKIAPRNGFLLLQNPRRSSQVER
jgi:hypothetical protein